MGEKVTTVILNKLQGETDKSIIRLWYEENEKKVTSTGQS